jgi:hypothetical protein
MHACRAFIIPSQLTALRRRKAVTCNDMNMHNTMDALMHGTACTAHSNGQALSRPMKQEHGLAQAGAGQWLNCKHVPCYSAGAPKHFNRAHHNADKHMRETAIPAVLDAKSTTPLEAHAGKTGMTVANPLPLLCIEHRS